MKNRLIAISFLLSLVLLCRPPAAAQEKQNPKLPRINCAQCHICGTPSADDPCLKACPRLFLARNSNKSGTKTGPDMVVLNKLVNQYGSVHFNHKVHSSMAGMGNGCASCHHYSPEGKMTPCSDCHGNEANPANLRQPGLKGAYHRQCIACHREWSHDTDCQICHMPLEGRNIKEPQGDPTDIMGQAHPRMTEPTKKVYFTRYDKLPVVTFFHNQHTEMFSLKCVDCHNKENCSTCHDLQKPVKMAKTQEEVHAICSGCHAKDRCEKCHDSKEKTPFMHASTGWPLNSYHAELECRSCHPTGKRIGRMNSNCVACHGGWNQETFKHAAVGLQLDETHAQAECTDCHAEKRFDQKPVCSGCHDDNRDPKANPPGKLIGATR